MLSFLFIKVAANNLYIYKDIQSYSGEKISETEKEMINK